MSKYEWEDGIPLDIANLVMLGRLCLKLSELLEIDARMGVLPGATVDVERAEGSKYPTDVLENVEVDAEEDVDFTQDWVDSYLTALVKNAKSNQSYVLLVERHRVKLEDIRKHDSILNRSLGFKLLSERLDALYRNLFIRLLGISVEGIECEELKFCTENSRWRKWIKSRGGRENIPVDAGTSEILGKLSDMLSDSQPEPPLIEGKRKGVKPLGKLSNMLSEPEQPLIGKGVKPLIEGKGKGVKEFQQPMDYREKGRKELEKLKIVPMEVGGGARERMGVLSKKVLSNLDNMESRLLVENKRANPNLVPMDSQESRRGKQLSIIWEGEENTVGELIIRTRDKANKIIDKDEKDIEPIKIWVDDYLKNIRHRSLSFQSYFDRINRDMGRLDNFMERLGDFMLLNPSFSDESLLSIIIAYKMLNERERYLYEIFFMDIKIKDKFQFSAVFLPSDNARFLHSELVNDVFRLLDSTREAVDSFEVIGCLIVTKVIGVGGDGIPVLQGYYSEGYDKRPRVVVVVKRFPKTHYSLVVKEKGHLIESFKHANITTGFGVESDEHFHYICLEPYMSSLYDLIVENGDGENKLELWRNGFASHLIVEKGDGENKLELWRNGFASQLLKNLIWDIAAGLTHLHTLKIVHGDLKPHNVLVIKTSTRVTAKISHIGITQTRKRNIILGENIQENMEGWQPREVLRGESQGASVDLFSLGCIMFFCITQGKHPFGEYYFERDANIIRDKKNLFLIEDFPEAFDLISRLLNSNPELRPMAEEVIHHPFFWDSEMQKTFLFETNNRLEDQNSQLLKTLEGVSGCKAWNTKIDSEFLKERVHYRRSIAYNFNSIRDLLFLIRNCVVHYDQFSDWSKRRLGSDPEGVLKYFSTRFPKLFIDVYNVILEHDKKNKDFSGATASGSLTRKKKY